MKIKISIIVPIYNVEKYLNQCIDSILMQTFRDFELILIDDGSPDNCGEICDDYQAKDDRIRVFHQENAGVSAARNLGLKVAQGEYIAFVDSDDWLEQEMYEILYNDMQKYQADITICNHTFDYEDGRSLARYKENGNFLFDREMALNKMLEGRLFAWTLWNMLYKKSLFEGLNFNNEISIGEDILICFELFKRSNKISYNSNLKYHYRQRENSACSKSFSKKSFDEIVANKVVYEDVLCNFPELREIMFYRYHMAVINAGIKIIKTDERVNKRSFQEIQNKLNNNIVMFCKNRFSTISQKLYALTFFMPYIFCCKIEKYIFRYMRNYKNKQLD